MQKELDYGHENYKKKFNKQKEKTFKIIKFSNTLNVFPSNILHKYIKDHVER
jgi:hypothetical protein